ncbi:MAG: hypothetical protein KGJ23_16085 [Euryarchaeota archaeon]|nr:hypothetical protein [Euryarchaeota archaeon]MDE2046597.1 hypothetical protein [Thermoplasmata archaeon]
MTGWARIIIGALIVVFVGIPLLLFGLLLFLVAFTFSFLAIIFLLPALFFLLLGGGLISWGAGARRRDLQRDALIGQQQAPIYQQQQALASSGGRVNAAPPHPPATAGAVGRLCRRCRGTISPGARFCANCGSPG